MHAPWRSSIHGVSEQRTSDLSVSIDELSRIWLLGDTDTVVCISVGILLCKLVWGMCCVYVYVLCAACMGVVTGYCVFGDCDI